MLGSASYVDRVPLNLSPNRIPDALRMLRGRYSEIVNLHTFGKSYHGSFEHAHNKRAFLAAGLTERDFYDVAGVPLVFDRSPSREQFLLRTHVKTTKPLILVSLLATSSPFNRNYVLRESILAAFGDRCEVVDLCRMKAPRLYDVCGVLERAAVLVCVDSAFLHLAAAVPGLPVVALVGDNPLTAAEPRYKPILTLRYGEAVSRVKEIHAAIANNVKTRNAASIAV
jgi:glycosyl transferase family 9 (putative heptosyltransferase)